MNQVEAANAVVRACIPSIRKVLFSMGARNRLVGKPLLVHYMGRHPKLKIIFNKSAITVDSLLSRIYK